MPPVFATNLETVAAPSNVMWSTKEGEGKYTKVSALGLEGKVA